jgi:hypothetical protein
VRGDCRPTVFPDQSFVPFGVGVGRGGRGLVPAASAAAFAADAAAPALAFGTFFGVALPLGGVAFDGDAFATAGFATAFAGAFAAGVAFAGAFAAVVTLPAPAGFFGVALDGVAFMGTSSRVGRALVPA